MVVVVTILVVVVAVVMMLLWWVLEMLTMNRTLVQVVCIFSDNYVSNDRRSQNNIKLMLFLLFLLTLLPSKSH